jgi:two-component system CheB/CheR fusion protein
MEERRTTAAPVRESRSAVAPHASAAAAPGLRLLVVDDNIDACKILARLLETEGHQVHLAFDGEEAVRVAGAVRPEVVLLDIGLPGIDGYEVGRRIRELPEGGLVTLIAISGWGREEDKVRSADAGFRLHLVKPVEPRMLMRLLVELCNERRGVRTSGGVTARERDHSS